VGRNLIIPGGTRIIDARGKFVIPGNLQIIIDFSSACEDSICCLTTGENGRIDLLLPALRLPQGFFVS
jgi:hypothetical protein